MMIKSVMLHNEMTHYLLICLYFTEYFQQLNEDQKQVVTGFMSVISNTLQACTMQQSAFSPPSSSCSSQERFYASPSSSPLQVLQSTFSSHLSETRPIGMANALPEYEVCNL